MTAAPALAGALAEHPALSQWVAFPAPGKVTVFSGKVEIGQGVLTAMVQLAAEELDVAAARIAIESGDTDLTPNEGFTAGSQSMQFGGVALRQACAEVRAAFLRHAAQKIGCDLAELSVADGRIFTLDRSVAVSPVDGEARTFHRIESVDWVQVLPITDAGEAVLVRQYRHGAQRIAVLLRLAQHLARPFEPRERFADLRPDSHHLKNGSREEGQERHKHHEPAEREFACEYLVGAHV